MIPTLIPAQPDPDQAHMITLKDHLAQKPWHESEFCGYNREKQSPAHCEEWALMGTAQDLTGPHGKVRCNVTPERALAAGTRMGDTGRRLEHKQITKLSCHHLRPTWSGEFAD